MTNETNSPNETNEFDTLFRQEYYTPEEAAELAGCSIDRIYEAAHAGRLKARIVGQDVVSIARADLIDWMTAR